MSKNDTISNIEPLLDTFPFVEIRKGRLDLIVLRYMACRIFVVAQQLDIAQSEQPQLYMLQERRGRAHRIALYSTAALFTSSDIQFVGFLSKKRVPLSTTIIEDIEDIDRRLLHELGDNPGLLSYSSLQFRNGNWCNLVLFRDNDAKKHLRNSETHAYAAHQLAPRYYDWVRLHNGVLTGGLAQGTFTLHKTRLYIFNTPSY